MYPVSDGFLRAVKSNTRKYYWTGTIVTRGGMTYEFGAKEIVKGSGYISRQCCGSTEIELGTAYAAEIDAMPNGGVTLSVYTENDIETCRDVLFYVAQVLGGFFIINREGKLELRKYGKDPVMKVEQRHRFSSSFSDFITRYTAVSSTNKQTQIAEYYALDLDNGLTMNLGVNPLLQFGLKETREMLCRNILADLSVIQYVPFDSDTIGNPALDPGDVLTFAGGQADEGRITCITSIRQKIGGKQSLKCVGKNPRLAQAKSRNDKNISGLLNQIEDNAKTGKIGIHTFTNASAHEIGQTRVKLLSIQFASSEENHMQFFAQVVVMWMRIRWNGLRRLPGLWWFHFRAEAAVELEVVRVVLMEPGRHRMQEVLKMMRQGMKLEILLGMRIQGVRMMSLVARIPDPEPGVVRRFLWM